MNALTLVIPDAILAKGATGLIIPPSALRLKAEFLEATKDFTVATVKNLPAINEWLKSAVRVRVSADKSRKEVNEDALREQRESNAKVRAYLAEIIEREDLLKSLVVKLADETAAAARAAYEQQRKQQEEIDRQARQLAAEEAARDAAIQRAEEAATRSRLDAERAAAAALVDDSEAAMSAEAAAQDAAEDARAEAAAIAAINAQAEAQLRANAALAKAEHDRLAAQASATVAGTKAVWAYEVVNLRRLAQHGWDTGKELVDITVRKSEIAAILRDYPTGGAPPIIPGITVRKEFKA